MADQWTETDLKLLFETSSKTNEPIIKSAVKPHQTVPLCCCKGTSTKAYGVSVVHTRELWMLTAPESVKWASFVQSTV